ncbi:Protein of unknown function [Gryllus bimaculatus]|nr:Protein of unknown function [Gryllus bimaculatus]
MARLSCDPTSYNPTMPFQGHSHFRVLAPAMARTLGSTLSSGLQWSSEFTWKKSLYLRARELKNIVFLCGTCHKSKSISTYLQLKQLLKAVTLLAHGCLQILGGID